MLALRVCEDMFISGWYYVSGLIAETNGTSNMGEQLSKTNALDSFTSQGIREDHNVSSRRERMAELQWV